MRSSSIRATFSQAWRALALGLVICSQAAAAEPPITALAFSPDGKTLVVGSQAGLSVRRWPDLTLLRRLKTDLLHVHDVAFSPHGGSLAACGGVPSEQGTIEVFSWPAGTSLVKQDTHLDLVYSIAWHPGSQMLATASLDRRCRLIDVASDKVVQTIEGHSRGLTSVCFNFCFSLSLTASAGSGRLGCVAQTCSVRGALFHRSKTAKRPL